MKNILFVTMLVAGILLLIASGCHSATQERAVFAQGMTDPSEHFTASVSGNDNEILVIQLSGDAHSDPENLIKGNSVTTLRDKGFKRVQIIGNDKKVILEKNLD